MADKYRENKKKTLFRTFLLIIIDFTCLNIYLVISGITHNFNWTVERLTTTTEGLIIQFIQLIAILGSILLFLHIVILIGLYLKGSHGSI